MKRASKKTAGFIIDCRQKGEAKQDGPLSFYELLTDGAPALFRVRMDERKPYREKQFPSLLSGAVWRRVRADFGLTRRESEILEAIARALPEARIARDLGVALDTVRKQRRSTFRKLSARNRLEAVLFLVHRYIRRTATGKHQLPPGGNCGDSGRSSIV